MEGEFNLFTPTRTLPPRRRKGKNFIPPFPGDESARGNYDESDCLRSSILRLRKKEKMGRMRRQKAKRRNPKEIGLWTKINGFPREMIRDCLKAFSSMGVSTRAKIKGAGSYLNFFMIYPTKPKKIIMPTSMTL